MARRTTGRVLRWHVEHIPRIPIGKAKRWIQPSRQSYTIQDMKTHYWQVLRRVTVYDSPWVRIHRDDIRLPDGSLIDGHHVVDVPRPAVGVIPVGDDGRILLIEHYRFITKTIGWEIPAGGIDPSETAEAAAARELLEETGHRAEAFQFLGQYHPSNGLSNQTFHVYIGNGISRCGEITDTNEVSRIGWFTPTEVAEMLRANAIRDGFSLTGLLWFFFKVTMEGKKEKPE